MGKILMISANEPCQYGGRAGGPVILINDILGVVDADLDVDLLVYKKDHIESELPANVKSIPWSRLSKRSHKKGLVARLPKNMYQDVSSYTIDIAGYDKVILYPYHMALLYFENNHADFYTIGMDSGPMLYLRGFLKHRKLVSKMFCCYMFLQALAMDRRATDLSKIIFTVGESDAEFYRSVYLSDARFVHHPVSPLINTYHPIAWHAGEKLKISFPGSLTRFYSRGLTEKIIDLILNNAKYYRDKIEISFLRIQYKELLERVGLLKKAGFTVEHISFAENFEEYLAGQHLAICPLVAGAGTKNKSLSLLGMGCDMIGSTITMENVYGVKPEHIAYDAADFIRQINLRLDTHTLYSLKEDEINDFKEYHSASNWNTYFWKEVRK